MSGTTTSASPARPARTGTDGGTSRRTERGLLLLAVLTVLGAYLLLGWSRSPQIPTGAFVYGGALVALAALGHLVVRYAAPDADPLLLPSVFLLNGIGLVLVRRIDFAEGSELAVAQTTWTVVGIGLFAATLLFVRRYQSLTRYHYTFAVITLLLLLMPLLPVVGREINGARLWVRFPGFGIQPGEFAKVTMVVFLAGYLERKRALLAVATQRLGPMLLPPPRHLGPVMVAAGVALVIMVAERDLGLSLLFFGVFVVMLYIATGRLAYPALGGLAFGLGAFAAYQLFSHVRLRYEIWIDPWSRVSGDGFQVAQAQFALGTGGLTGTGLGLGRPGDIPFASTDAIFAVIGEELGLLGATAVLLVFLVVIVRGYKLALMARDETGTLLAAGLTSILALQVFVIVGGVTRLVPFTGITLPFISYGGSSLLSNYLLVALLLRISDDTRGLAHRPAAAPSRGEA